MQRIAVALVVSLVAGAALWLALGSGEEQGDAAEAPVASGRVDAFDRIIGPPLDLARREPAAPPAAVAETLAEEGAAPELAPEEFGEPPPIGSEDPMTGSGGGSSPSRAGGEGRRPPDGFDGPSRPGDAPPPPADLPLPPPADVPDPTLPDVDPIELADLEARVAERAIADGLVDPAEADAWAGAQVDPHAPATVQASQREAARNEYIATEALSYHILKQRYGPNLPPNERAHKAAVGKQILSLQSDAYRVQQLQEMVRAEP
jgi:hypothetical protein